MTVPTSEFTHLWNDLPAEERKRLMPYAIESQILHIWQVKQKAIKAHKKHMRELDDWLNGLNDELNKYRQLTTLQEIENDSTKVLGR